MSKRKTFNEWFLSLEEGRQEVLRDDKWMLAAAAFEFARDEALEEAATSLDSWGDREADGIVRSCQLRRRFSARESSVIRSLKGCPQ